MARGQHCTTSGHYFPMLPSARLYTVDCARAVMWVFCVIYIIVLSAGAVGYRVVAEFDDRRRIEVIDLLHLMQHNKVFLLAVIVLVIVVVGRFVVIFCFVFNLQ